MRPGELLLGFAIILRLRSLGLLPLWVILPRDLAVQPFDLSLGLLQKAGIPDGLARRVRVEDFEAEVNARLPTARLMFDVALGLHAELDVVAVGPADEAHALDAGERERLDAAVPTSRTRPMPQPSVKVRCLPSASSFQPVTLYSTLRLSCWKRG
jgi:hypothetical protein